MDLICTEKIRECDTELFYIEHPNQRHRQQQQQQQQQPQGLEEDHHIYIDIYHEAATVDSTKINKATHPSNIFAFNAAAVSVDARASEFDNHAVACNCGSTSSHCSSVSVTNSASSTPPGTDCYDKPSDGTGINHTLNDIGNVKSVNVDDDDEEQHVDYIEEEQMRQYQEQQQQQQQQRHQIQTQTTQQSNNHHYNQQHQPQSVSFNVLHSHQTFNQHVNIATEDPTFLTDRCLENALKTEEKRPQITCSYFKTIQKEITPAMRKIVAEWMMEVCAEQKCQDQVVLLALIYMDRFLSTKSVRKTHLQILAAACLLLASKLREPSCQALSADMLVFYTDNSIYKEDLINWELFVLSRLGWDLSSVTPLDFLDLLLMRLPIKSNTFSDLNVDKVRNHATAFISLAAKEHIFSVYSASTIAASSIAAALSGLKWHARSGQNQRFLLNLLTDLTSVEQDSLHECMMKMEEIFEEHSRKIQPYLVSVDQQHQYHHHHHHQQQQQQQELVQKQQQHEHQQHQPHQIQTQQHPPQQQEPAHHSHHGYHEQNQYQHQQQQQHQHHTLGNTHFNHNANKMCGKQLLNVVANALRTDLTQTCKMQANAQNDVKDIKF